MLRDSILDHVVPMRSGGNVYWLYTDKAEGFKLGIIVHENGEIAWGDDILKGTMLIDSGHPRRSLFTYRWIDQSSLREKR